MIYNIYGFLKSEFDIYLMMISSAFFFNYMRSKPLSFCLKKEIDFSSSTSFYKNQNWTSRDLSQDQEPTIPAKSLVWLIGTQMLSDRIYFQDGTAVEF